MPQDATAPCVLPQRRATGHLILPSGCIVLHCVWNHSPFNPSTDSHWDCPQCGPRMDNTTIYSLTWLPSGVRIPFGQETFFPLSGPAGGARRVRQQSHVHSPMCQTNPSPAYVRVLGRNVFSDHTQQGPVRPAQHLGELEILSMTPCDPAGSRRQHAKRPAFPTAEGQRSG